MKATITASSVISPQHTNSAHGFPQEINEIISDHLSCLEPDYGTIINPIQLRRMPRILKMGLASAQLCINRAGGISPDAIIVGTGLGCLDNLEKFLLEVLDNHEHITSVLPFIYSTHNAVAAQIAMLLKNYNYNITYCHRGFSFESALQDALMQIEEKQAKHVMVGGIDECTHDFMLIHSYLGYWKQPLSNLQLLNERSPGTIAGEGSAFFMLSAETGNGGPGVSIEGLHTFFTPSSATYIDTTKEIDLFLGNIGLDKRDIDSVMFGLNGNLASDASYYTLQKNFFSDSTNFLYYKHLCGEYYTASAFAMWLASVILTGRHIPDVVKLNNRPDKHLSNILIYNHIHNTEHSLIFLNYGRI